MQDSRQADGQDDERAIRQLVATWLTATKAGDIDTVLTLMADDVVFLLPGQPPMMGKSAYATAAKAHSGQAAPQFDGSSEIQELKVLGDWAFLWSKLTVSVTPSGGAQRMTRAGHTLTILNKQNGRWVLARDANMLVAVPDSEARS
ncbi:MAG TPA: SgcJ/EcaC family oxidoreductase [Steroidobacteraceae bacterium]